MAPTAFRGNSDVYFRPDLHRHGYFQACPPREYLPLFWSDSQLELLQGTELGGGRVQADRWAQAEAGAVQEHKLGSGLPGTGRC